MTLQNYDKLYSNKELTTSYYETSDWKIWNKPTNCKFVSILCIGGGGGGGGGTAASGIPHGGGGGGGSGAVMQGWYAAIMLPNTLYIYCGSGGLGGSGATYSGIGFVSGVASNAVSGASGGDTYVSIYPDFNIGNRLCWAQGGGGGGGGITSATVAAAGGAGGRYVGVGVQAWQDGSSLPMRGLGIVSTRNGRTGGAGAYRFANGTHSQFLSMTSNLENHSPFITGGGGGGEVTNTEGTLTTTLDTATVYKPTINTTSPYGKNGLNSWINYDNLQPDTSHHYFGTENFLFSTGGTGARSGADNNVGGRGGFGSGGGGGAATGGTTPRIGGYGGNGGSGLVIIQCL